jgi:hypothetical protein
MQSDNYREAHHSPYFAAAEAASPSPLMAMLWPLVGWLLHAGNVDRWQVPLR